MLDKILKRKDVSTLIREICNNSVYRKKTGSFSVKYECSYQVLFILFDALFKFQIIVGKDDYLDNYILQLDKIFRKFSDIYDIEKAISELLLNICLIILNIDNKKNYNNKRSVLKFIYDKYVINGYVFHGFSGIYKESIEKFGFNPACYNNKYSSFIEVDNIFRRNNVIDVMNKDFYNEKVYFTDGFLMACFYGANSPMYYYHLLCDNLINSTLLSKDLYLENDYYGCFNNLNQTIKLSKLNNNDKKIVMRTCLEEWKFLQKNNANINILLVKRSVFGINYNSYIEDILNSNDDFDLSNILFKLFYNFNDKIVLNNRINPCDIEFCLIPNYVNLFKLKNNQQEKKINDDDLLDAYGKVSILVLIGTICITLGVILTIIMISRGI